MTSKELLLSDNRDIKEESLYSLSPKLLALLLFDQTSEHNIIWATDDYLSNGSMFGADDPISVSSVTGQYNALIRPRVLKNASEQENRIRDKAEVFTPSWVCNAQNNLIDNAWFGRNDVFNTETNNGWETNLGSIEFTGRSWKDYVSATRLEVSCGEAPYLTSRYDTVSGEFIDVPNRIGLLDRKLRIISENTNDTSEWVSWALIAAKNIYGFEWQGDNVLLARENILYSILEAYYTRYNDVLSVEILMEFCKVISWNIWQMDGIRYVIPNTCHETEGQISLSGVSEERIPCPGCKNNNMFAHNGTYSEIMDWKTGERIRYVDLVGRRRW